MGIFDRFFKKKCQHNLELKLPTNNVGDVFENFEGAVEEYCTKCGATRPIPECQHNWQIEQTTHDIVGFMIWEGPVKDYCTKCGATRPHPENC